MTHGHISDRDWWFDEGYLHPDTLKALEDRAMATQPDMDLGKQVFEALAKGLVDYGDLSELERDARTLYSFACVDCGKDTMERDFYMVRDSLWRKYGAGDRMLCLGCLQKRVPFALRMSDFPMDIPANAIARGDIEQAIRQADLDLSEGAGHGGSE